jgi:hypothetical protein
MKMDTIFVKTALQITIQHKQSKHIVICAIVADPVTLALSLVVFVLLDGTPIANQAVQTV